MGFAIRIGLHNSYDVILYVWRPYLKLYKLYYKNTNNLLPQYFNSFNPYYNNEEHSHNLRSTTLCLPNDEKKVFLFNLQNTNFLDWFSNQSKNTPVIDLNRIDNSTIYQFSAFFKYSIINKYDLV